MFFQVGIHFLICINYIMDEALVFGPAPGLTRTDIHSKAFVFSSRYKPFGSFAIPLPVELATGINKALYLHVSAIEQKTDKGVVVIEFWVGSHNDTWSKLLLRSLCTYLI